MVDYKSMYLKMMNASEDVINRLIQAQRECEEIYLSGEDPELVVLKRQKEKAAVKQPDSMD